MLAWRAAAHPVVSRPAAVDVDVAGRKRLILKGTQLASSAQTKVRAYRFTLPLPLRWFPSTDDLLEPYRRGQNKNRAPSYGGPPIDLVKC